MPFILSGCAHLSSAKTKTSGIVIVLNGPSASGKSSIQRAFQRLKMPNLWVKVGIDNLFDSPMPDITVENLNFWQQENQIRWITSSEDVAGKKIVTLHVGEQGNMVAYAMNSAIADYAAHGCNVIVDYLAYKKDWFDDLQTKLKPYKTFYVAIDISREELERRETLRNTSPVGHARSHYSYVYWDKIYDLRVDSEKNSAEEIAQMISQHIGQSMATEGD